MYFLEAFLEWASSCLENSDEAQSYLLGRGVSAEQIRRHRIGFVGGDFFPEVASDPKHSESCKEKDGPFCESCRFMRWSTKWTREEEGGPKIPIIGRRIVGSIVFPLTTYSGCLVGIQIRSIAEKNYDTFLIRRRPEGFFFGAAVAMPIIWVKKEVFLVEGPFDYLTFERLAAPNVLGLTNSSPGKDRTKIIQRFASTVNMCLDLDAAGRKGFRSFFNYNYSPNLFIRDFKLPNIRNCKDLNEAWRKVGDDGIRSWFASMSVK